jgi:DNA-binding transcriptional LysR family regulator
MTWLPQAMQLLHPELKNIHVTVTSDYSPYLAEALTRGQPDLAFLRVEPGYDLDYQVVDREPLIVLMPSDHRLTARKAVRPQDFAGEIFIGGSNKASVLRAVTEDYLRRSGLDIKLDHGVDNMAMAMSLVASTRGLALMPAYAKNLLPGSVVSSAGRRGTDDRRRGGLQQVKRLADPQTVPVPARRTDRAEPEALTPHITSASGEDLLLKLGTASAPVKDLPALRGERDRFGSPRCHRPRRVDGSL